MVGQSEDDEFVKIAENDASDEFMEVPVEKSGTLLLSTVQAQFPSAIGLKYKSSSGGWRGIRAEDNVLDPPSSGWGGTTYYITQSDTLKRKSGREDDGGSTEKKSGNVLQDVVVFGLPFATTDEELKEYFAKKCGEMAYHEIKHDRETKKSRGFAFIRFITEEGQREALEGYHEIDGRKLTVRLAKKKDNPIKLFVGRLRNGTTRESVLEYFQEFGVLSDVFVPVPFRGFGFVTYESEKDGHKVARMRHILNGANLNVTVANPIEENRARKEGSYGSDYRSERGGGRTRDRGGDRTRDRSGDRTRDRSGDRTTRDRSGDMTRVMRDDGDRNDDSSYDKDPYRESSKSNARRSDDSTSNKDDLKSLLLTLLNKQ